MLDFIARGTYRLLETLDRPARTPSTSSRGIALILALVTIAIVSAAVVQYSYSTRVNLSMSVNSRDKLKSYFLARSGMSLARLLLNFQYALKNEADRAMRQEDQGNVGSCNPRMISTAMRKSNFQMYQYLDLLMRPFNSGKLETPVGGINLSEAGVEGFGKFAGRFDVDIEPESGKLNVNRFAQPKPEQEDVQSLCSLVQDSRYTEIAGGNGPGGAGPGPQDEDESQDEPTGATGGSLNQQRAIQYIVDYIDLNETELPLTDQCTLDEQGSGDEEAPYSDSELDITPRNAKLTHIEELYQVYGVSEGFMRSFEEHLTVYPVGKPNANMATFPVFYSNLCRNVTLGDGQTVQSDRGLTPCQANSQVRSQVMLFAMALDGIRQFFQDPLSVMMAYVGASQSRLLPSAKKGQPIAFLQSSQIHSYLRDLKRNPQLMARFLMFSPTYKRLIRYFPKMAIEPRNPSFPKWQISFDRAGIIRDFTTQTPSIYRIEATGTYGNTETTIEAVVNFDKPIRRLPKQEDLQERVGGSGGQGDNGPSGELKKLQKALRERRKTIPKGRVLYWRENVQKTADEGENGSGGSVGSPAGGPSETGETNGAGDRTEKKGESDDFFEDEGEGFGSGGSQGQQGGNDWNFDFNEE